MPVRSSSSSVLKWPDRDEVDGAVRRWAVAQADCDRNLLRVGYFGSYARGDWGVGSDLDVVLIVHSATEPFAARSRGYDLGALPVSADLLVYTADEWSRLQAAGGRFATTLAQETVWLDLL